MASFDCQFLVNLKKLRDNLNMHFKGDPVSDVHAKKYLIILSLKHFPGPTKFGPVFWSRLFQRVPVEYNYPVTLSLLPPLICSTAIKQNCIL